MSKHRLAGMWCAALLLASLPGVASGQSRPAENSSSASNYVPEGTTFIIRLSDKLDTSKISQGKHFKAKLAEDLTAPNGAVIPRGKTVKGHVSSVEKGFHARLLLSFDEIDTQHGWMPLVATVTGVPGEHGVKQPGSEGEIERKGPGVKRTVEGTAVGAGIGAAGGAVAGGGRGAMIGAAIGAGVGAGTSILTDRNLKLDKGQQLELRLDRALQVPTH